MNHLVLFIRADVDVGRHAALLIFAELTGHSGDLILVKTTQIVEMIVVLIVGFRVVRCGNSDFFRLSCDFKIGLHACGNHDIVASAVSHLNALVQCEKRSFVDCQGHELILDVGGVSAVDIPVLDIRIHHKTDGKRIIVPVKGQRLLIVHLLHLIETFGDGSGFYIFDA